MRYKVATVSTEPITKTEAKLHLRVTDTTEDTKIEELITAAREYAEAATGKLLAPRVVTAVANEFPKLTGNMVLPVGPIVASAAVTLTWKDYDGTITDISADVDVDEYSYNPELALKPNKEWPDYDLYPTNPIAVSYTAGKAPSKKVKNAMLLLIGHWFDNREEVVVGNETYTVPFAAETLLQQERHTTT
jgi:uncharacterized phiE125 gp8 family phage protein